MARFISGPIPLGFSRIRLYRFLMFGDFPIPTRQGLFPSLTPFLAFFLFFSSNLSLAETIEDPSPPEVTEAPSGDAPAAESFERLTFRSPPKPLDDSAVTSDWPRFLGPSDNAISPETHLLDSFPEEGLEIVWEIEKGSGYTSPVIADGRLVMFDRFGDEETIECLDPETGKRFWRQAYPVTYTDRYGFNNGPRASAVIHSGKVYTLGVTSVLSCLDLVHGTVLWQRNLKDEFEISSFFFGHGACPLVHEGLLIVPLGTNEMEEGLSVVAFDIEAGRLAWATRHEWNASYASPIVATLQGEMRLLVFQGGESRPAFGGLLAIDPETGELLDEFAWRPDKYESVNSSTPIAVGDDQVFITSTYDQGGALLRLNEDLKWEQVWNAPEFGIHWMTPLHLDGHLYGYRGRNEPDAWLASFDAVTGKEKWRSEDEWSISLPTGRDYRMRYFRGSLLHADGKAYALGEMGTLGILALSPEKVETLDRTQLFLARATWSLPALSRGLLYVSQHEATVDGEPPRLICYDLRK
ncbi:MAG: PQQ-binding-like beta-propeller repeat protein [Verrucomicrobiota bacterium]